VKGRARGRHVPGRMNQVEARFAERLKLAGRWWMFEPFKLALGPNTTYAVDFAALGADGILDCYEIKAHKFNSDESRAKFKVAASLFPFRFWWCVEQKDRSWEIWTPYAEDRAA